MTTKSMTGFDGDANDDDGLASLRDLPPPPMLGAALEAELGALAPVAPRRPRRRLLAAVAVSLAYASVILAMMSMRRDLATMPMPWFIGCGVLWLAAFVGLEWVSIVPKRGAVMPRWRLAAVGGAAVAVLFVVLGLVVAPAGPDSAHVHGIGHRSTLMCLGSGLATALVPIVLGALALRGAVPVGSRWLAAGLGAAGGSLGGLMLHLHCPIVDGWHVGLVHGGVVVLSALLAAAIAPRQL